MSLQNPTPMEISPSLASFGLVGDFAGDEDLLRELNWCCEACQSPSQPPPLARLISLLESLPLKGRHAVVRNYLASSPHRDAILRDLFDYCLQMDDAEDDEDVHMEEDDEDEFVLIANPSAEGHPPKPLNLNKFHIFQVVIVLMALSGPAGAEMSRRYLGMASTKYRAKILIQCVGCEDFTDQELWDHYCSSPSSVQNNVIKACKRSGRRKDFLRRVYEQEGGQQDLIYWLESDYLASQEKPEFKLKLWGAHGDVYIAYIRRRMQECKTDKLKLGSTWQALRGNMELNSVKSSHVYALLEILDEYEACYVQPYTRKEAREYLEGLSASDDNVSEFIEIHRLHIDKHLVCKLTKQERLQLAVKYLQARDLYRFGIVKDLVPHHKLPYKIVHSDASSEDLWSMLLGQADPFLRFFATDGLFASASAGPEQAAILKSWTHLHLRCKPSDLSDDELSRYCHGKSSSDLWRLWYNSYRKFYEGGLREVYAVIAEDSEGLTDLSPRFKAYTLYMQEVLEIAVRGLEEVSTHLGTNHALRPVLGLLRGMSFAQLSNSGVESAQSLARKGVQIITDNVVPRLGEMMQFDPTVQDTYINQSTLSFFESSTDQIVDQWALSEKVARSLASTVLDVCARASQHKEASGKFAIATDVTWPKRRKFTYFDFSLHQSTVEKCYQLAKKLLSVTRNVPGSDPSLAKELWDLVHQTTLPLHDVSTYLYACSSFLPSSLFDEEKPSMIERAVEFITSTYKKTPDRWKAELAAVAKQLAGLGLLETVVQDEAIPMKVRNALLIDHGGFGNEKAQQSLKDSTFSADAESRAAGLTVWLTEACKTGSVTLVAEAMSFAASRVKNEAGIHRRTVFSWLEEHFAEEVVLMSLEDDSEESSVHEALCSAIVAMQKNDLSRLDCVGRQVCFPRLSGHIIKAVLEFDPTRPCLERRQLWVSCAIQMHWELQAASGGEESLHCYKWPIGRQQKLKSASWVSLESFKSAYPSSKPSSAKKIAALSRRVNLSDRLRKEFSREDVFGPMQCVEMLEKAIDGVWVDSLPSCPLRLEGRFPDDQEIASALCKRLEVLFRLSGDAWQEVELLTTVFDRIFSDFETASVVHCEQASGLLDVLFEVDGPRAFEVPRVALACDKLFRHAVATEATEQVQSWLDRWQTVYLEYGSRTWDVPVDDRLQNFVRRHGDGCEPEGYRRAVSKSDRALRECSMARELLSMSPSALLLPDVRKILFTRRQDVLLRCLRDIDGLQGVFRASDEDYQDYDILFRVSVEDYDTVDELLFHTLDKETLLSCHSEVSRRYAQYARTEASSSRRDLKSKIEAIIKFMNAPSTQHADVLAALQSELEDAVREALINRVFLLDSPWHILGFLLSQKAIEKNDQRVTAALLGHVAQHVTVDKVVSVISLLLKEPRRKKLSFQLHKGVIRMLFDAKTQDAMQLLCVEWENELPDGVRSLIVDKCVQSVAAGETDGWEASVLSQVATNQSFDPELKFRLFAPQWDGAHWTQGSVGGVVIPKADGVSTDEMLDQFRQKGPAPVSIHSTIVAEKFRSILEVLENSSYGSLKFLAKLKKLSLSNLFGPLPRDDQGALDDMLEYLTSNPAEVDHKTQVGMAFMSVLFATGVCNVLNRVLPSLGLTEQAIGEQSAVGKLRACIRAQLDAALDLPIRHQSQRTVLLKSLDSLMKTVKANCAGLHDLLVVKPFKKELIMLINDANLVNYAVYSLVY